MLSVRRAMLVVVLKAWVTEMKEAPCASNSSTSFGEVGERARQPIDLVDHDYVDPSRSDIVQQLLKGGSFHRPSRKAAIVVAFADELPSLVGLALDVGF
jgi:hypothetical protein